MKIGDRVVYYPPEVRTNPYATKVGTITHLGEKNVRIAVGKWHKGKRKLDYMWVPRSSLRLWPRE